ncbi:MAG: ABC transporter permease [Candidatus Izemoplasmatales bacterium]
MFIYVIKRILSIVVAMLIVMTALYVLLAAAMYEFWTTQPFDQNINIAWNSYKEYFYNIIHYFDFGKSNITHQDVWPLVWPKFKLSMMYNGIALILFVPIGIYLGIKAALHKNKTIDVIVSSFAMIFNSIPAFLLIFFLVVFVGYGLNIFPPIAPAYSAPLGKQLLGLVIPVFALVVGPIGKIAQLTRGEIVEMMSSDHFLLAKTKGLTTKQAIYRHGFREAMTSVIPEIIPTFMLMIGFSFVVETTYNIFGVSKLLLDSLIVPGEYYSELHIDVNVVVAIGVLLYGTILIASLISDIVLTLVDPRIHMIKKKDKSSIE